MNFTQQWLASVPRRPRLLVVDDQPINIRAVHALFRDDYDVFMATSGAEALSLCKTQSPDLILLDVMMTEMDGHEVCRRLKADPASSDIPIIFITANDSEAEEVQGLELGAVDFIVKPIHPVIVRARVQNHLALKFQSDMLRMIAMNDGLTGVANRRKFDEDIEVQIRHCRREKVPLSLLLLDVDYFKRFNDRYGHLEGDQCLKAVAQALRKSLNRPYDLVARYGGEEFACLLPNTPEGGALCVANRLITDIKALAIPHEASDVERVVTISVGVATLTPLLPITTREFIVQADKALYEAKRQGRARACAARVEPSP